MCVHGNVLRGFLACRFPVAKIANKNLHTARPSIISSGYFVSKDSESTHRSHPFSVTVLDRELEATIGACVCSILTFVSRPKLFARVQR